jgi:hypothetical protein
MYMISIHDDEYERAVGDTASEIVASKELTPQCNYSSITAWNSIIKSVNDSDLIVFTFRALICVSNIPKAARIHIYSSTSGRMYSRAAALADSR